MTCKERVGEAKLYSASESVLGEAVLHPRGCMGARQHHLDIILSRDPCGLKELLERGGHCVTASLHNGILVLDLSGLTGYPCVIEAPNPLGWRRVYVMLSRSGSIYISSCRGRR